jgi:peptidoglycan biosynthesis protein MviN/MurJ (putative lipid II flippase)
MLAMLLRLVWLAWRLPPRPGDVAPSDGMPAAPLWLWAMLAAGLPLALPFAARSLASHSGEGALATFNYAWKLVELPLLLAIQLVATLAFPAIARGLAGPQRDAAPAIRAGFALAWTLACAAAGGLFIASPALADLLFGWGRMQPEALVKVARWGAIGAWGLLPQSVIAVGLTVLAARGGMRAAVLAYAAALGLLIAAGASGVSDGAALMRLMNGLLVGVCAVVLAALGAAGRRALPWRAFAAAGAGVVACRCAAVWTWDAGAAVQLAAALGAGVAIVAFTAWLSADLRAALRR